MTVASRSFQVFVKPAGAACNLACRYCYYLDKGPLGRSIANGMQTNGTLLDDDWGLFLAAEGFAVGLSLDGPKEIHDRHRLTRNGQSTFDKTMRAYKILKRHGVPTDILWLVS